MSDGAGLEERDGAQWPRDPFTSIWVRPRATIRRILDADPRRHVLLLAVLSGIAGAFGRMEDGAGHYFPLIAIVFIALGAGAIQGVIGLYLWGFLIQLTGRWIGGAAKAVELRAALAWSSLPLVVLLALYPFQIALFGQDLFYTYVPAAVEESWLLYVYMGLGVVEIGAAVWWVVLSARTVAEAQGFRNSWTGLGNLVLAFLVFFVPLALLVFGGMAFFRL